MDTEPVISLAERVAILEYKQTQDTKKLDEANKKLDDLLSLKQKGAGAFWLATTLFGIGFTAFLQLFFGWWHSGG